MAKMDLQPIQRNSVLLLSFCGLEKILRMLLLTHMCKLNNVLRMLSRTCDGCVQLETGRQSCESGIAHDMDHEEVSSTASFTSIRRASEYCCSHFCRLLRCVAVLANVPKANLPYVHVQGLRDVWRQPSRRGGAGALLDCRRGLFGRQW